MSSAERVYFRCILRPLRNNKGKHPTTMLFFSVHSQAGLSSL